MTMYDLMKVLGANVWHETKQNYDLYFDESVSCKQDWANIGRVELFSGER